MEELAAVLDESSSRRYYYWHQLQADDLLLGEELMMMSDELMEEKTLPPTVVYAADDSKQQAEDHRRRESMVNKLISTVYSGPTISDIESALSFTGGGDHHQQPIKYSSTSPVVFSPEKVLSKMENKYTLKIKTCGNNGLVEDGYKWRKYGQKSIKNSPNPRSYYRCTNPRCNAKKQVERATDEPDTLLVTYEGLHLHYTYSHFLHAAQAQQQQKGLPKKPKRCPTPLHDEDRMDSPVLETIPAGDAAVPSVDHAAAAAWGHFDGDEHMTNTNNSGLLEDVVPLLVRHRPCGSTTTTTSTSSPPSPSTSTSISRWTPTSPYIDMANIFF